MRRAVERARKRLSKLIAAEPFLKARAAKPGRKGKPSVKAREASRRLSRKTRRAMAKLARVERAALARADADKRVELA